MIIGIDLGTTFSVGAYIDSSGTPHVVNNRDGSHTTPSVVMFDEDEIVVGIQAKNNADQDPSNVVQFVKRNMGDKSWSFESDSGESYTAEDISAMILKRIKEDCESETNEEVTEAVITVPAYFNDAQRTATMQAGALAGLNVKRIINEPTAAAIAYGLGREGDPQRVMVYDLGGGTFDVTILEIGEDGSVRVLATHGNRNLGGFDFDNKLMLKISEMFKEATGIDIEDDNESMQILRNRCEEAKIALSSRDSFRLSLNIGGQRFRTDVTRADFESLIAGLINDTEIDIDIALEDSGLEARDIDKVLLVGGSTRIPAVREFVRNKMGINPSCELNADEAVAIGAAIFANTETTRHIPSPSGGDHTVPAPVDVNSHGLGVVAVMDKDSFGNDILGNSIIIPRNQPIPVSMEHEYTVDAYQTLIELQVTEGDDEDLEFVSVVGTSMIHLNPHPTESVVRVTLGYDKNAVIHCTVFDVTDNCVIGDVNFQRDANLSDEEIQKKKARLSTISIQ